MKILSVKVENFLRCVGAEVSFDGDAVILGGKNGNGKSSFAKAIWAAFGGKDAVPVEPVTEGAEQAIVKVELDGDFVIERKIWPNGDTQLELKNKDGGKYRSPQSLLDAFNLKFGFWPQNFIEAEPKAQAQILRSVVPGLDFRRQDMKISAITEERKLIGRDVTRLRGEFESAPHHEDVPASPVDVEQLSAALAEAHGAIAAFRKLKQDAENRHALVGELEEQAKTLRSRIEALQLQLSETEAQISAEAAAAIDLDDQVARAELPNVAEIQAELQSAAAVNQRVADNARRAEAERKLAAAEEQYQSKTAEIQKIEEEKREALAAAKFPIPGLGFNETGVTYRGKPFENASEALKWETAVSIGFALNPELKLVYVERGSLLDLDTYGRLRELVAEKGGQLLLELVGDDGRATVVFEDGIGRTRAASAEPEPQPANLSDPGASALS
jgi:hypothetical protein